MLISKCFKFTALLKRKVATLSKIIFSRSYFPPTIINFISDPRISRHIVTFSYTWIIRFAFDTLYLTCNTIPTIVDRSQTWKCIISSSSQIWLGIWWYGTVYLATCTYSAITWCGILRSSVHDGIKSRRIPHQLMGMSAASAKYCLLFDEAYTFITHCWPLVAIGGSTITKPGRMLQSKISMHVSS